MRITTLERTKKSLRRNVRTCKGLFCDLPEPVSRRRNRLVKLINDMHDLENIKIEVYTFNVYGCAHYTYNKKKEIFKQNDPKSVNDLFPKRIAPEEFIKAIDENVFIVSKIVKM